MRIWASVFLTSVAVPAAAGTLAFDLVVNGSQSPFVEPSDRIGMQRQVSEWDIPDQDILTDNPAVFCRVEDSVLYVHASGPKEAFASLPMTETCKYGSEKIKVRIVPQVVDADHTYDPPYFDAELTAKLRRAVGSWLTRSYVVPAGLALKLGAQAESNLPGASCSVASFDREVRVAVSVTGDTPDGKLECTLPGQDGGQHTFRVALSSAPGAGSAR